MFEYTIYINNAYWYLPVNSRIRLTDSSIKPKGEESYIVEETDELYFNADKFLLIM